jgi:hypothetical protein
MKSKSHRAREQFRAFAARPGMFLIDDTFDSVAAFVSGLDYANDHALLNGFDDWFQRKQGVRSPLIWSALIKEHFEHFADAEKRKFDRNSAQYLRVMIEQFIVEQPALAAAE